MGILRQCLFAGAVPMLVAVTGAAQEAPRGLVEVHDAERSGFWGALGFGAGGEAFGLRDGLGYSSELYRPTVSLRLGGTPNRYLRLGGEILGWIDDHSDRTESIT